MSASVSFEAWTGIAWARALIDNPCESEEIDAELRCKVRARQVQAIVRVTPTVMLASLVNALALVLVLWLESQLNLVAVIWAVAASLASLIILGSWYVRRSKPFPISLKRKTTRRVVVNAGALGALWAIPGLFLLPHATGFSQGFLIAVAAGTVSGGSLALYPIPAAAVLYGGLIAIGGLAGMASTGDPTLVGFTMVTISFLAVVAQMIKRHAEIFVAEFVGRLKLDRQKALFEQLLVEARCEAEAEKQRTLESSLHAQKIESIGKLSGGVAHDFNNLLAAIQGNAELLGLDKNTDQTLISPILQATARGSELVNRLLAFSRRQHLRPECLCLQQVIDGVTAMLCRTLGAEIAIKPNLEPSIWHVHADPGQLEAAIVNLALNARDAMPDGGDLRIEGRNVVPENCVALRRLGVSSGEFAMLSVSDSGEGMPPSVRERALDPFFTTKPRVQGAGLGLSSVYGFVRQSGGQLWIESEAGVGTTVSIFLPRAPGRDCEESNCAATDTPDAAPRGQGEDLLIIEDYDDVRHLVREMLTGLGYTVHVARDVAEAERLLAEGLMPNLVLTDVVLPGGTSGPAFADRLAQRYGVLRTVFMSGLDAEDQAATRDVVLGPLLRKPFHREQLARTVRSSLDA